MDARSRRPRGFASPGLRQPAAAVQEKIVDIESRLFPSEECQPLPMFGIEVSALRACGSMVIRFRGLATLAEDMSTLRA